ncbi:hypothetical protein AKJ16_DCAP12572 [Drosera capensis]
MPPEQQEIACFKQPLQVTNFGDLILNNKRLLEIIQRSQDLFRDICTSSSSRMSPKQQKIACLKQSLHVTNFGGLLLNNSRLLETIQRSQDLFRCWPPPEQQEIA